MAAIVRPMSVVGAWALASYLPCPAHATDCWLDRSCPLDARFVGLALRGFDTHPRPQACVLHFSNNSGKKILIRYAAVQVSGRANARCQFGGMRFGRVQAPSRTSLRAMLTACAGANRLSVPSSTAQTTSRRVSLAAAFGRVASRPRRSRATSICVKPRVGAGVARGTGPLIAPGIGRLAA